MKAKPSRISVEQSIFRVGATGSIHPSPPQTPGTPAGTIMTPEYVESVGRMAYIWGWPLVNNFNRAAAFATLPGSAGKW